MEIFKKIPLLRGDGLISGGETMNAWIGVDLDGTLAEYDGWHGADHIGLPIPLMLERVKRWIAIGKTVKIFTARANDPENIPHIQRWLDINGLHGVGITNIKDFGMVELWDDRCIQVVRNTGIRVDGKDIV